MNLAQQEKKDGPPLQEDLSSFGTQVLQAPSLQSQDTADMQFSFLQGEEAEGDFWDMQHAKLGCCTLPCLGCLNLVEQVFPSRPDTSAAPDAEAKALSCRGPRDALVETPGRSGRVVWTSGHLVASLGMSDWGRVSKVWLYPRPEMSGRTARSEE